MTTELNSSTIASMIDHTLLKAEATTNELIKHCKDARDFKFYSVCVNPSNIKIAKQLLEGSGVKTITVVGFPLGANLSETKAAETKHAIAAGADEIDMVINIAAVKMADWKIVESDIFSVVVQAGNIPVKVILETAILTTDEIEKACTCAENAGAKFVKTSTGFHPAGGATLQAISIMRRSVSPGIGVKASGGIRSFDDAKKAIEAGANRLGTSASVMICKGLAAQGGVY